MAIRTPGPGNIDEDHFIAEFFVVKSYRLPVEVGKLKIEAFIVGIQVG